MIVVTRVLSFVMSLELQDEVRRWAARQESALALAPAIRRLVELGLKAKR